MATCVSRGVLSSRSWSDGGIAPSRSRSNRPVGATAAGSAGLSGPVGASGSLVMAETFVAVTGAQPLVDIGIVDDLARQEDARVRKALARLVRVVDRAVDPVAEPELPGQVECQASGAPDEPLGAHGIDQGAVIRRGELTRDRLLEVQPLAKNYGRHDPAVNISSL